MNGLAQSQDSMLRLIKARPVNTTDSYLDLVESSGELAAIREIALWWSTYHLQRTCIHTARLMRRLGLFDQAVAEFCAGTAASPFSEEIGMQFVAAMSKHADPLVASMAQLEAALLKVRGGSAARYSIEWDRNPNDVFRALEQSGELPASEGMPCYFVEVAANIRGMVCCTYFGYDGPIRLY
jgi:hypothetical protein